MKRFAVLWALVLALLTACGQTPEPPAPPEEAGPIRLASLSVEGSRLGLDSRDLTRAVRELPEALGAALAAQGVEAERVTVTVGSSPEATAQAVREGGVDVAFLPAGDFDALESPPELLLLGGRFAPDLGEDPAAWDAAGEGSSLQSLGVPLLLCAGPTEYGRALAEKQGALSREDLAQARWAILEGLLPGDRAAGLFLPEGQGELPEAAVYQEAQDLFRAAAAGEADLVVLPGGLRLEWSFAWTLEEGKADNRNGHEGLGRSGDIYEELPVLDVSEKVYEMAAVVRPEAGELGSEAFAQALAQAVNEVREEFAVFGEGVYASVGVEE